MGTFPETKLSPEMKAWIEAKAIDPNSMTVKEIWEALFHKFNLPAGFISVSRISAIAIKTRGRGKKKRKEREKAADNSKELRHLIEEAIAYYSLDRHLDTQILKKIIPVFV